MNLQSIMNALREAETLNTKTERFGFYCSRSLWKEILSENIFWGEDNGRLFGMEVFVNPTLPPGKAYIEGSHGIYPIEEVSDIMKATARLAEDLKKSGLRESEIVERIHNESLQARSAT